MQRVTKMLLIVLLVSIPVAVMVGAAQTEPVVSGSAIVASRDTGNRPHSEEPLLVTSLDGKITAIDEDTGEKLWSFDTESPLVSARDSRAYEFSIIPGVQGELYSQQRQKEGTSGFQLLPQNLPQWVEQTPAVMGDGSLWLGSRHTHAFFVDANTGKLLKSYVEYGDGPLANTSEVADIPEDANPILIGRVDYTVRAVHQESGEELFNVTYSRLLRLDSEQQLREDGAGKVLKGPSDLSELGIALDPYQKTALVRVDPKTRERVWRTAFEQPPVAVFANGEAGVSLHEQAAFVSGTSTFSRLVHSRDSATSIAVDRIGSSYYALPIPAEPDEQNQLAALLPIPVTDIGPPEVCDPESPQADLAPRDASMLAEHSPVGVHLLDTDNPSPLAARKAQSLNNQTTGERDADIAKSAVADIGLMSISLFTGGGVVVIWIFIKITEKPRVIASMKENKEEDIRTLTLSYTGTTQDADEARRNSRAVMEGSNSDPKTKIKDFTGSGYEHNPEADNSSSQEGEQGGQGVDSSPFSASEAQAARDSNESSGSRSTAGSPRPGSKKRKKTRSGRSNATGSEKDAQRDSGNASESGESSDESDEENRTPHSYEDLSLSNDSGPVGKDRRFPLEQPSSSGRDPAALSRRSAWRDGVTYIGRLAIGPGIVGYGSSGTLVFEGSLDGRQVAVKRVLRQFYELARKEIGALIVADEHPNIVRCFAMEEDVEFVYLALERCKQSLNDLLGNSNPSGSSLFLDPDGNVTDFCMQVCEEAGRGLMALHERGIVHRDLKPHNVLLTEGKRTKLSDMGLCKRLTTDQTSYDSAGPGGSTGWQAPEQLILRAGGEVRQGRGVDIFTFGLLVFYCMTGGKHAFGDSYERDYRILNGRASLEAVAKYPEALSLIRAMLRPQPKQRPSMASIMAHPFWWPPAKKLAFLIDVSNRVENEDREVDRSLLQSLESFSEEAIGNHDWAGKLSPDLLANLGRYRKYNPGSLRDLLRVIRNKHNHFREMPEELQQKLGPLPSGFYRYFSGRFPGLLLATYTFALEHCSEEPPLQQYFPAPAKEFRFAAANLALKSQQPVQLGTGPSMLQGDNDRTSSAPAVGEREPALATVDELREGTQRSKSETALFPPPAVSQTARTGSQARKHRGWWSSSESSERSDSDSCSLADRSGSNSSSSSSSGAGPRGSARFLDPAAYAFPEQQSSPPRLTVSPPRHSNPSSVSSAHSPAARPPLPPHDPSLLANSALMPDALPPGYPIPAVEREADGTVGIPDASGVLMVDDALKTAVLPPGVRQLRDAEGFVNIFPQRVERNAPECDFFLKTGHCKFGETCRFHHPVSAAVKLTAEGGYPLRPEMPVCPFYARTGTCKYAASCKFHHPASTNGRNSDSSGTRGSIGSQPSSNGSRQA